tara:strand:+ start:18473 stop:19933 length:1461 start_codon:yes stop_codon:yes gene_type:complete
LPSGNGFVGRKLFGVVMQKDIYKLILSLCFLSFLAACELTEEEQNAISDIIGEDQNPGSDFEYGPLEPNCHQQIYKQPEAEISKKVDLLFVIDTSGSLDSERQQIGDGVDAFLSALPSDVDVNIGVSLGHVGSRAGKLYRKSSDAPLVLKSSEMDSDAIRSQLSYRMRYTAGEGASDGGEAMLYSFYKMLDPDNVQAAKDEGFFRDESALVVVFVTDENDICARYPDGVTPVYDPQGSEVSAFNNYCGDVTPESVLAKANIFASGKPLVMAGIVYHEESVVPSGGENEMAYGILELIDQASGAKIDLAGGNYHIGLNQIGSLAVKKLSLKTDFVLASSNVDAETFEVKVDNVDVPFSFNEINATVTLTDYAGIENSEVFIGYCEPPEEPDLVAPVISNLAVNQITGGSAVIEWSTDIAASSQVKITHVASGSSVLTNLMPSLKTEHAVGIQGLNPDTLYKIQAISVTNGMESYSGELSFRTGRSIN